MRFIETELKGAFILELERKEDSRGFFARAFCRAELLEHGLNPAITQCNISFNPREATLRGMHYQADPFAEVKLVRCTSGAIYDVIIDLRRESSTYRNWIGVELSAENRRMLYVPPGFAHGYMTLVENSEVFYQVSQFYHPEHERGIRWNDSAFAIQWPRRPEIISPKDSTHPDFA
jgi:dTDP-4-dehydrorhamnose 3,5-epimerase